MTTDDIQALIKEEREYQNSKYNWDNHSAILKLAVLKEQVARLETALYAFHNKDTRSDYNKRLIKYLVRAASVSIRWLEEFDM